MGSELVTQQPSHSTITELFDEACPYYMSMGMSYDEFWLKSVDRVKAYRKADEYKRKRVNHQNWMLGAYFYHALCDASPLFLTFAPEGTKSHPYLEEPFPVTEEDVKLREEKERQKEFEKLKAYFDSFRLRNEDTTDKGSDENVGSTN